jgi:hypothetical protein
MSGSPPLTPLMLIPLSLLSAEYPASWRAHRHTAPQDCSVVVGERGQLRELRRIRQGECVIQLLPVVGEAVVVAHRLLDQRWVERQRVRVDRVLVRHEGDGAVTGEWVDAVVVTLQPTLMSPYSIVIAAASSRSAPLNCSNVETGVALHTDNNRRATPKQLLRISGDVLYKPHPSHY